MSGKLRCWLGGFKTRFYQLKLMESIKEVSTSNLVTSQSTELKSCVEGMKENMKDGLKVVEGL